MLRTNLVSYLAAALLLAGCSSDSNKLSSKSSIAQASAGDLTAELLADGPMQTGLTPVYVRVSSGGVTVTDATLTFMPMMSMSAGTKHSAPVIGPAALGADQLYALSVVFQMATSDMGTWSATVGVTRPGKTALELTFPALTVADSGRAKTFSYVDPAGISTKYVASFNFKAAPKVGLNPAVLTLHRMQDMMTFIAVEDASLELDPQMPSMGHGSPGSVSPTATSLGRYEGQVSFSMPGSWETTVTVKQGAVVLGLPKFTTVF
ncbi:MAG: FixH family protein [Myxococcales bacterium]